MNSMADSKTKSRQQKKKKKKKKKKYRTGNNISGICLETPKLTDKPITKIINNQLDIRLRQFIEELNSPDKN